MVPWRTLRHLTSDELAPSNEVEIDKRSNFTSLIHANLGDLISLPQAPLPVVHEDLWDLLDPVRQVPLEMNLLR